MRLLSRLDLLQQRVDESAESVLSTYMYTAHDHTTAPTVVRICTKLPLFLIVASLATVKYCASLPMSSLKMTTWVKHSRRAIVTDMELYDGREVCDIPIQIIDSFSWRIESIYRELLAAEAYGELTTVDECEIPRMLSTRTIAFSNFRSEWRDRGIDAAHYCNT